MGWDVKRMLCLFVLGVLLIMQCAPSAGASIGVVYGYDANNLPLPSQVVQLLTTNSVTRVRIYDTNSDILRAFMGSTIELIVGINNTDLVEVGATNVSALKWVTTNILPFITSVNITGIAVGNEVMTSFEGYSPFLAQAMIWIRNALVTSGIAQRIEVSTPFSTALLLSYFPPSQAIFNQSLASPIRLVLQFLNSTGVPLYLNVHSYDAFQSSSAVVSLLYALFEPSTPLVDTYTTYSYFSLFDALVDSTYAAMNDLGFPGVTILVTGTGWPSLGDSNENGANPANAQAYNGNLVEKVRNNSGTPARSTTPISAYVYELFNENLKPGPTSERNYGLFEYNLTPVYTVDLTGENQTFTANATTYRTWCVAQPTAKPEDLLDALNWACGEGGVNCSAISTGGACFTPDTLVSHSSWAFNDYYQQKGNAPDSCSFGGTAFVVSFDPSYGSCTFQASNATTVIGSPPGAPSSPTNIAHRLQYQSAIGMCCVATLLVLNFRYLFQVT